MIVKDCDPQWSVTPLIFMLKTFASVISPKKLLENFDSVELYCTMKWGSFLVRLGEYLRPMG